MRLILILLSTALICDSSFAARRVHANSKSKSKVVASAHSKKSKSKKSVAKKMTESQRKALAKKQVERARKIDAERKRREAATHVAALPKMNVIASPEEPVDAKPTMEMEKAQSEDAREEIYTNRQISVANEESADEESSEITDFADFNDNGDDGFDE